jgi:hypothetical protein
VGQITFNGGQPLPRPSRLNEFPGTTLQAYLKMPMRILIRRILLTTILLACLVYAGDYVSLQLQIPNHRAQLGTVMVERDYAVPLKNRSTEYMFDQPVPVTCVHSLFPHFGDPPCWYLRHHARQEIKMGRLFALTGSLKIG